MQLPRRSLFLSSILPKAALILTKTTGWGSSRLENSGPRQLKATCGLLAKGCSHFSAFTPSELLAFHQLSFRVHQLILHLQSRLIFTISPSQKLSVSHANFPTRLFFSWIPPHVCIAVPASLPPETTLRHWSPITYCSANPRRATLFAQPSFAPFPRAASLPHVSPY